MRLINIEVNIYTELGYECKITFNIFSNNLYFSDNFTFVNIRTILPHPKVTELKDLNKFYYKTNVLRHTY